MIFDKSYLERLARVETPDNVLITDYQRCYDYCQLRNSAKDLLRNQGDERTKRRLSRLMLKLKVGILN